MQAMHRTPNNPHTSTFLPLPAVEQRSLTMHGKKRAEYKDRLNDPKTAAVLGQKAQQWHALMEELHHRRRDAADATNNADGGGGGTGGTGDYDEATAQVTLSLLEKALMVNPDPLNLWNHRRQVLLQQESQRHGRSDPGGEDIKPSESGIEDGGGGADASSLLLLETEFPLTHAALQRNPKAYGAWMHRKWVLSHVRPPPSVLEQELSLTSKFLSLDERNFHCWNYRRFVVGCLALATVTGSDPSSNSATVDWTGSWMLDMGHAGGAEMTTKKSKKIQELMGPQIVPRREKSTNNDAGGSDMAITAVSMDLIQSEFDFTTTKIKDNFSNFSAFHYRCQLLDVLITSIYSNKQQHQEADQQQQEQQQSVDDLIEQEFQLMEDAFCTEPDDQTAWWYHSILLDKVLETQQHQQRQEAVDVSVEWMTHQRLQSRLNDQAELLRELLEESSNCKWVMLGLARVLEILIEYEHSNCEDGPKDGDENEVVVTTLEEERRSLLSRLVEIDPDRGQRYKSMR